MVTEGATPPNGLRLHRLLQAQPHVVDIVEAPNLKPTTQLAHHLSFHCELEFMLVKNTRIGSHVELLTAFQFTWIIQWFVNSMSDWFVIAIKCHQQIDSIQRQPPLLCSPHHALGRTLLPKHGKVHASALMHITQKCQFSIPWSLAHHYPICIPPIRHRLDQMFKCWRSKILQNKTRVAQNGPRKGTPATGIKLHPVAAKRQLHQIVTPLSTESQQQYVMKTYPIHQGTS